MASESATSGSKGLCLLVVVGEIFEEGQKELILNNINDGLNSIDESLCGQNVSSLFHKASENLQIQEDNEGKCLSHKTEECFIDILIKPNLKQLSNKLKSFLTHPCPYHHLIFAGSSIRGSSNWILADATFSFINFSDIFKSSEVATAIKEGSLSGTVSINCKTALEWSQSHLSKLSMALTFKLNPPSSDTTPEGIVTMKTSLSHHISFTELRELLEESSVVGSIRFHHPTIYIFPAGLGASCLFGVSGFSLLVDGGFMRKSCFWDFSRHLDRLDALLLTHIGEDNLFGVASAVQRKQEGMVNPELGCVFANCISNTSKLQRGNGLEVDVGVEGGRLVEMMREIGIKPRACIGATLKGVIQPINLYHKVGHGSLDLYVLAPLHDSRPLKDFLTSWSKNNHPFNAKAASLASSSLASVCAVVVWQPSLQASTRLLFPGTAPQHTILEALDRLSSMPLFQSFGGKTPVRKTTTRSTKVASTFSPRSSTNLVKSPRSEGSVKSEKKWPVKKGELSVVKNEEKKDLDSKKRELEKEGNGILSGMEGHKSENLKEKENEEEEKASEKQENSTSVGKEEGGGGDLVEFGSPLKLPPPTFLASKHTTIRTEPRSAPITSKKSFPDTRKQKTLQKPAFYCDLAYIPNNGDPRYVDADFFWRVRARYYVLSNPNASSSLLTSLLEAREGWGEDGEVVVIPTHDTEVLRFWMAAHHDQLSQAHISVAPAANRCSIQLQDHQTSCAAYRLEF